MSDENRLEFIRLDINRGSYRVEIFAAQAMLQYKRANLAAKRKFGKNHHYRIAYIESYLFHKKYLDDRNLLKIQKG
jgi:hypothetical protein